MMFDTPLTPDMVVAGNHASTQSSEWQPWADWARSPDGVAIWFPALGLPGTRAMPGGAWRSNCTLVDQCGEIIRLDYAPGDEHPQMPTDATELIAIKLGFFDEFGGYDYDRAGVWLMALLQPKPEPEPTGPFFVASRLAGQPVPSRDWLVPDLIPARTVTLFGGDGGTGKSLLAMQLAVATATGGDWLGRDVTPGRALVMSAEDDADELHRRLADIVRAEGLGFEDLDRLTAGSLAGEDALLAMLDRAGRMVQTPLFDDLERRAEALCGGLMVLDTLADLHSGDENNRAHARHFIGLLRGLAIRHGVTVVVLAHPSLSGMASGSGLSGSTAWNGSVRSRLSLERIKDGDHETNPDARVLRTVKANYGRTGGEITMRWQGGVFVADAPETGFDRRTASGKAERVFMSLLRRFTDEGRYVSASPGPTYAPAVFAKGDAEGVTKRALIAAMDALFKARQIVVATHGTGAKARSHLAIMGEGDE